MTPLKSSTRTPTLRAGGMLVVVVAVLMLVAGGCGDAPTTTRDAHADATPETQPAVAAPKPIVDGGEQAGDRDAAAQVATISTAKGPQPPVRPESAWPVERPDTRPADTDPVRAPEGDPSDDAGAKDVPATPTPRAPSLAGPEKSEPRELAAEPTTHVEPVRAPDVDVGGDGAKAGPRDVAPTKNELPAPDDAPAERSADAERTRPAEDAPASPTEKEPPEPVDIDAVLRDIEKSMKGAKTTQSSFVQEKKMAILKRPLVIRGRICLQKPGRFAWYALSPLKYSIVLKDEKVYTWDEDTRKVRKSSLKGNPGMQIAISHITQWFAGKYSSLQDSYGIRLLKKSPLTLEFTPREGAPARDFMRSVSIVFDEKKGYLKSIFIAEKSGNTSLMTFTDVKIDAKLEPHAWEPNQNAW